MISRINMVAVLISLIAALGAGRSLADGVEAEISFAPASDEAVWLGEKLELHLELWSNALSFSDQWFVLPEVQGAFLIQAESIALKLSEKRNGDDWQGLRYSFQLYPQRAGKLSVPSFGVRFAAREAYGTPEQHFEFATPVLSVEARLPPGASASGLVVSSTDFSMRAEWDPLLEDGAVAVETRFLNGREHGPWRVYFPDGTTRQEGTYAHGDLQEPVTKGRHLRLEQSQIG